MASDQQVNARAVLRTVMKLRPVGADPRDGGAGAGRAGPGLVPDGGVLARPPRPLGPAGAAPADAAPPGAAPVPAMALTCVGCPCGRPTTELSATVPPRGRRWHGWTRMRRLAAAATPTVATSTMTTTRPRRAGRRRRRQRAQGSSGESHHFSR